MRATVLRSRYLSGDAMVDHSRTAKVTSDPEGIVPVMLVARTPDAELGRLTLTEGSVTVGSGSTSHLVVDHPTVSRQHLKVELRPGGAESWLGRTSVKPNRC